MTKHPTSADTPIKGKIIAAIPIVLLVTVYLVLIIRRAWVSDDAYITFRTIDNFINGYRLTWNVGERVQAYTHPLWMFVMSGFYYITREIYLTSMIVSLGVSLAGMVLYVMGVARGRYQAAFGIIVLCLSNAYIDYSTSGLENPMSHLLLVVFMVVYLKMEKGVKRVFWMSMVASLGLVNRMDMGLMYLPLLVVGWWESGNRKLGMVVGVLGQLPFIGWEIFSVIYYGFPFPNTAYAKLSNALPAWDLIHQGGLYFLDSLERDPLTLVIIFSAIIAGFLSRKHGLIAAAAGILGYLAYILKIGGDFMSGRFFTSPLLFAVMIFSILDIKRFNLRFFSLPYLLVLLIGLGAPMPTFRLELPNDLPVSSNKGVTDERVWYFKDAGLFGKGNPRQFPDVLGREAGLEAKKLGMNDLFITPANHIGVFGFYAGQNVYIIDQYALADPLLARIPPAREIGWYIGHFKRIIPDGYATSIYTRDSRLTDQKLAEYYTELLWITRGKLTDPRRWAAIWGMNTGKFDHLIDFDKYRYPDMAFIKLSDISATLTKEPIVFFGASGLDIDLGKKYNSDQIEIALDWNDDYQIIYYLFEAEVSRQTITGGKNIYTPIISKINIPRSAYKSGYNHLRIFPVRGDPPYSLSSMSFLAVSP